MNRYLPDDRITYLGKNSELNGHGGRICAPVRNVDRRYVVDLDNGDSIVASEDSLVPFRGDMKRPSDDKPNKKEVKVEKRRGGKVEAPASDEE
jgi:hypothetical protein